MDLFSSQKNCCLSFLFKATPNIWTHVIKQLSHLPLFSESRARWCQELLVSTDKSMNGIVGRSSGSKVQKKLRQHFCQVVLARLHYVADVLNIVLLMPNQLEVHGIADRSLDTRRLGHRLPFQAPTESDASTLGANTNPRIFPSDSACVLF